MVQHENLDPSEYPNAIPPPPRVAPPAECSQQSPQVSAPPLQVVLDIAQEQADMLMPLLNEDGTMHQPSYDAPSMPTLNDMPSRGSKVTITGLMSHYDLNGKEGIVVGFRADGAVLVDIPFSGVQSAPIHTENLVWGDYINIDIAAPSFLVPKMNTTQYEGKRIIRVRPPRRVKSDATCCPAAFGWSDASFFKQIVFIYSNFACALIGLTLWFCYVLLAPFTCGYSTVLARWMSHRQLDVLLTASPPRRGIVVTHPLPVLRYGGCQAYICNGHTWRCMVYAPLAVFFSMQSVMVSTFFLPFALLGCIRPLYALVCNVTAACLWLERSFAVCLLAHVVGEYDAVCGLLDEPATKKTGMVDSTRQVVRTYGSAAQMPTDLEILEEGISRDEPTQRSWLVPRERTLEEQLAAEKFHSTFLKLFGRQARLQDISIQPPREAGRGPRHFVTLADSVDDANRLKLIKSYKQMFSTMYVHIVDIDEQERQGGTDYSEMYG